MNATRLQRLAHQVAEEAHSGQLDKGGAPYLNHPVAVAGLVATDDEKVTALLHDVVEDTPTTLDDLRSLGFPEHIIAAVDAITERPGEARASYYGRVRANPIARNVKIADITHNSDLSRIPNISKTDRERTAKYQRERLWLLDDEPHPFP